jgi:hypothetical protein
MIQASRHVGGILNGDSLWRAVDAPLSTVDTVRAAM